MKLPNGFGSVYKLSGKRRNPWAARITTGWTWNEETQKSFPVYKFIGFYPTRQEALTALCDYNQNPYDLTINAITFADVYSRWAENHFETISPSNVNGYKAAYRLCSDIADMRFQDIKLDHLQTVVNNSGKNTPTLKKLKILFGLMYDYAVIHEIVPPDKRAMVSYIDISKPGNPNAYHRTPFSTAQITTLWQTAYSNEYISVILILIYTGCRIGELLDLESKDVHLDEKYVFIAKSKTDAGVREIPIADKILPFITHWLEKGSDYLICTPSGEHFLYRNYYDSYWCPIMDSLGMSGHRPHDTRHTCVSLLTAAGVDKTIRQKIIGHKGQDVTDVVYTHLELPVKLKAINSI